MTEQLKQLRQQMEQDGLEGIYIDSASNRRYLTRFTGTAGAVLITMSEALFIADFRYVEQAKSQTTNYDVIIATSTIFEQVIAEVKRLGIQKLGIEKNHLSHGAFLQFHENLGIELVPTSGLVEKLRMIKTNEEIAIIRQAASIADQAFTHILNFIQPGRTERAIAHELEAFMRTLGATSVSFKTIIASGIRSSLPHGVASDKALAKGEMLTMDFGAYYEGYCSDMTRTVAISEPSDTFKEIYSIVLEAETQCIEKLKPGVSCMEIDEWTHQFIENKGYGSYFGHGTGHAIGLDIHEEPFFSKKSTSILAPGMIMTIEPGIYIPGSGGVRIEDDVLITENGYEILTHSPKELLIL